MMLYMTATPSQFTRESIKAWKGMLDGGSFMRAGWVHDIKLHPFTVSGDHGANRFIIMGKVKHSQRVSADFLLPWVVAKQDGEILAAHCTCMAGLGEACSHIAALLSCVINANEIRKRFGVDSCTSNLCAWNHPVKGVKPAYLADIKFYGQGSRKRCFGDSVNEQQCKTVCRGSPAPPATLQSSSSHSTSSSQSLSSQSTSSSQSLSSQQSASSDQPSSSQSTSSSQSLSSQQSTSSDQSSSSQSASSDQPSSSQSTSSSQSLSSQQSTSSDQSSSSQSASSDQPSSSQSTSSCNRHPRLLQTPEEDQKDFFKKLNTAKTKPAILKIVDPYFEQFIPKTLQPSFPKLLGELYNPSTLTLKYPKLMEECEKVFNSYKVSVEQVQELEANTRDQSHSRLWFLHRVGRITASNFKAAVWTDPCMPSQSLIKKICYPESYKFSTAATRWGCSHEQDAKDCYLAKSSQLHQNVSIKGAGLFVDYQNPYLGASPDGLVECACCGKGVLEVKCPFCHKDNLPEDDSGFYMVNSDGKWSLKRSHSYFYQVQLQLHVCSDALYADFVAWSQAEVAIDRIYRDDQFFEDCLEKARNFFVYGILPEIVGKCSISWFHFDCLRIRTPPKGKWYCPSCRKLKKFNRQKKNDF